MNDYVKNRVNEKVKEKKSLFRKDNVEALLSAAFCLAGSFFAAIIVSGYGFSLETFSDPAFYASTLISFGLMMYVFNFIKRVVVVSKKRNNKSEYYKNKEREERIIKHIRDNHLEDEVEKMVSVENNLRRKNTAQEIIDKVTYGLYIDDIEDLENENNIAINQVKFDEFVRKRGLSKRESKKLRKAINKVLKGKYEYEILTAHDLLVDTTLDHKNSRQMRVDESKLDREENKRKAITFIISTAITNSLVWNGLSPKFLASLLAQSMLILSSVISAYTVAGKRVDALALVSANKCDFLNDVLKIETKGDI